MSDTAANPPTPHTSRVHFHASLTLALVPLAVLAGCAWIALKAFVCWNARSGASEQQLCSWAFVLPDTVLACAGLSFLTMLYGLLHGGTRAIHATRTPIAAPEAAHAIRHSYHALPDKHRKRVKGASATLILGAALFVGAASWYLAELPPFACLAGAMALAGAAYVWGKFFARAGGVRDPQ